MTGRKGFTLIERMIVASIPKNDSLNSPIFHKYELFLDIRMRNRTSYV